MKVTDLIKLGEKSLKGFDEYIIEKGIKPPMRICIRHFITNLVISETGCNSQGSYEIIQKPDWTTSIFDFIKERIKPLPEFKQLNQLIAKTYKKNINKLAVGCNEINQSAFWLETYVQRLINEKLEGILSDDSLIEYASLFKSELELSSLEYNYVHYLDGLFLENDEIKINDNVLIRKTQKEDLGYTKDIFFDVPRSLYEHIPSSIMEINMSSKDEKDCHEYVNRLFNAFRLYKLGSVYSIESISTKKTIIWPMGSGRSWVNMPYSAFKKYTVKASEIDNFINFVNAIEQKLDFNKEEKDYRTLFISIERYTSALLESVDIDRKLMTSVMGLESLFTFEKDKGENAFKLGIRVAKLLGNLNIDSVRVREFIEEAYNFRNKVVHGAYISQENRKKMSEIFPYVLDYLRISLIIFLWNQKIGKDKIIDIIDESTISYTQNENLKKLLDECIKTMGGIFTYV